MYCVSPSTWKNSTACAPHAGDVARQLLHDQHGAFAAAQRDGFGHLGARVVDGWQRSLDRLVADEIADIGNDPRGAGFDELVVVELIEVLGQHRQLLLDQHAAAIAAARAVPLAVSSSSRSCWSIDSGRNQRLRVQRARRAPRA